MNVVKIVHNYLIVGITCPAKLFVIERGVQIEIKGWGETN